jgi:hypothetical protein
VAPNVLLEAGGALDYVDRSTASGFDRNGEGEGESAMGMSVADVDGDGEADLFVTNFARESNTLYRGDGCGTFEDVTARAGLDDRPGEMGWGVAAVDLDGDGEVDVVLTNGHIYPQVEELDDPADRLAQPLRLYRGLGGGRFAEATAGSGLDRVGPVNGRALVPADLDDDGRLDLVVTTHRGAPLLLRNLSAPGNRRAVVTLHPSRPGGAEGARVELRLADGSRRAAWRVRAQGYLSSRDPRLFFGLGAGGEVAGLSVGWIGDSRGEARVREIGAEH